MKSNTNKLHCNCSFIIAPHNREDSKGLVFEEANGKYIFGRRKSWLPKTLTSRNNQEPPAAF